MELTWDYKGIEFKSNCIIRKSIVFDPILSNIYTIRIDTTKRTAIGSPKLKSFGEGSSWDPWPPSDPWNPAVSVSHVETIPTYTWTNSFGKKVAEAYGVLKLEGLATNYGNEFTHYDADTYFWSDSGYSADCQINVTSFESGINGRCEFKWAVMVSDESSVSIGWNGSGFTIPGGSSGQTGSDIIYAGELY